jgi:hypothetical protein
MRQNVKSLLQETTVPSPDNSAEEQCIPRHFGFGYSTVLLFGITDFGVPRNQRPSMPPEM